LHTSDLCDSRRFFSVKSAVAQASRSSKQVQLRRLLRGREIVPFGAEAAHAAGALLGRTRSNDVIHAAVAVLSKRHGADVVSDDAEDIRALLSAALARVSILDI
jgi:predicted nucleic acid-binding protein